MTQYQTIFNNGATQEQIEDIKRRFASKQVFTWEEYYWGTKCIVEYDAEENDPDFIIKVLKKAFRSGLTRNSDPKIYQDSLKIISAFYNTLGNYDQVINHLMNYVDSMGDATPDWAYHDLINAQIHTDQIAIMIERPQSFLPELARNDNLSPDVEMKQKNLFRDFLICALDYIRQYPDTEANYDELEKAAKEYDLTKSDAWINFCEAGKYKSELYNTLAKEKNKTVPLPDQKQKEIEVDSLYQSLKNENISLKREFSSLQEQISDLRARNDFLNLELLSAHNESDTFKLQLGESEKKAEALQQELTDINELYSTVLDKIASGEQGKVALQNEISRLKDTIANLNREKQETETNNRALLEQYNSALKQIKADEDFKFDLQDSVRSLSIQLKQSKDECSELKAKLQGTKTESQTEAEPTMASIFGHCVFYLNHYCLKAGKDWLFRKLSKISKNYMIDCVNPCLTANQIMSVNSKGWTDIYDFDLAIVLRVIKQHLRSIPSFIPSKSDEEIINYMINLRNDYAHFNGTVLDNSDYINDILVMSDFVKLMGGDAVIIDEMIDYSDTIPE